ncbi:protein kinase family protein [Belliella baltica DSM 15883]|uniref:Protein kinase family protein n=1 Tax=Belliella baltica (strain DSM 15883 / CIP 108006 / LMG 21964 / BA134) TaxID=866536 RepID=I3Z0S3_BELBD|nr:protein kinase [Belliella baltica]AFL82841.1 protein kinase family protein [Belliella baltica DSM 15883]
MNTFEKKYKINKYRQVSTEKVSELLAFDHPNLVKIFNLKILEKEVIIEMEYCDGASVGDILQSAQINIDFVNKLIIQVLHGLDYIHSKKMLHGDLKLSNVLVDSVLQNPNFKIGDLDSIRPFNCSFETKSFYTPEIIAPEVYLEGKMDEYSDIWSFGVMLYQILSSKLPFGDRNEFSLNELRENVKKIKFVNQDPRLFPEPYNDLLLMCLVEKENRYTAKELLEILGY